MFRRHRGRFRERIARPARLGVACRHSKATRLRHKKEGSALLKTGFNKRWIYAASFERTVEGGSKRRRGGSVGAVEIGGDIGASLRRGKMGAIPQSAPSQGGPGVRSDMEFWKEVRRLVLTNELSKRAACEKYSLGWHTLKKILAHAEPPGYRCSQPRTKRKLERFLPIIHQILQDDRQAPKKQRHTAKRIFERLRDEHGFQGGKTIGQGRRAGLEAGASGGLSAAVASAGRGPGRFRRGHDPAGWPGDEGRPVRDDAALLGSDLCSGVSRGNARRASWRGIAGPSSSSAVCRGGSATTTRPSP